MPNLSMNSGVEMLHDFSSMSDIFKHTSASIICVIFLFVFCGDTRANETHNQFQFNCSEQGGLVIPNTGETFFSDYDGVEYQPSFSKTGIFLKSEADDFFINLKNGDLLLGTEVFEKCEILQKPANYKLSNDEFMFFCSEQGGLVIPNTGETFFSDYDGVEFQPSFSKTGIFLKSNVGNYAINLQSGDLLYGDDLSSDFVAESCEILRRPD